MTDPRRERDPLRDESPSSSEPLADLVDIVAERRELTEEESILGLFSERSFDAVGAESIWTESGSGGDSTAGAIDEVIDGNERTSVVPKRNFCERCRYLSSPPSVECTHEGSEIREFVDKDRVRVYSCPIVEERANRDDFDEG